MLLKFLRIVTIKIYSPPTCKCSYNYFLEWLKMLVLPRSFEVPPSTVILGREQNALCIFSI